MSIEMFLSIAISTNIHVYMLIFISPRYLSVYNTVRSELISVTQVNKSVKDNYH